jgi:pilus assembly protein Flp/PilA
MWSALRRFSINESGATAIEYAVISSLIGLVIITSVNLLGNKLRTTFTEVASNLH